MDKTIRNFSRKSVKNNVDKSHHPKPRDYIVSDKPQSSLIPRPGSVDISAFTEPLRGTKRIYDDEEGFDDFQSEKKSNTLRIPNKPKTLSNSAKTSLNLPKRTRNRSQTVDDAMLSDPFRTEGQDGFRRLKENQLTLPKKVSIASNPSLHANKKIIESSEEDTREKCPYCGEIFKSMTGPLRKAIDNIKEKDREYEKSQNDKLEKESATSIYNLPTNLTLKRRVLPAEKDAFCKLHRIELVIKPEGIKKNYPQKIEFDRIERRIKQMQPELDKIIRNELSSEFRNIAEDAYRNMGVNKARSTMGVMTRFEATLPGYYGPKGAAVILEVLTKLYLETSFLSRELVSPQLPLEFAQQVLVPEVGLRLIQADLTRYKIIPDARAKAREVMEESIQYGHHIFPVKDQEIESHEFPSGLLVKSDTEEDDNDSVQELDFEHIEDSD